MLLTIFRGLTGRNGRNWPGVVMVDPDARYRAAVWAQEAYEAERKLNPAFTLRLLFSDSARRDLELTGHEVEVVAAARVYGLDRTQKRRAEAASLARNYNEFEEWDESRIFAEMKMRTTEAEAWVARNLVRITDKR